MQELTKKGLYDIYTTWHIPFWQTQTFYIILLSSLVIITLYITWICIRWLLNKRKAQKTAWQEALEQLHTLQKKQYLSQQEGKQCYFTMTAIIKKYLTDRFSYPLKGKTDEEVIAYLATSAKQIVLAKELKEIIDGCLYIKFANEKALQKSITEHLEQCCLIIQKTIPKPSDIKNRESAPHK